MKKNRIRSAPARFWVSEETDQAVRAIAAAEGRSCSSVYRDLISKGLVAGGYRAGEQDMAALVKNTVEEALKPQVERLASISAKATQISAAAFFMSVYTGDILVPEHLRGQFDEAAVQARKLGIEYLKLPRDRSVEDFLKKAFSHMEDYE